MCKDRGGKDKKCPHLPECEVGAQNGREGADYIWKLMGRKRSRVVGFTRQDHALVQSVRRAGFPSSSLQDPDCTGQTQTTEEILCSQEGDCLSTETLSALPQDFMNSSSLFSDRRTHCEPRLAPSCLCFLSTGVGYPTLFPLVNFLLLSM